MRVHDYAEELHEELDQQHQKPRWILVLRITVSIALLALLITRVDTSEIDLEWTNATPLWLLLCAMGFLAGAVLAAWRWKEVIDALRRKSRLWPLLQYQLAGTFVSNFLPSSVGGDVVRVSRLAKDLDDPETAFASVVLERLTGWIVLPAMVLIGFGINPGLLKVGHGSKLALGVSLGTLVFLIIILAIASSKRLTGRFEGRQGWLRFLGAIHRGIHQARTVPWQVAQAIGVSFLYQTALFLAAVAAARAVGIDIGPTALFAYFPAVSIIQVLPAGIGGLGTREGALVAFLGPLGVPHANAIALGLLLYTANILTSLLGAPALAVGGSRKR